MTEETLQINQLTSRYIDTLVTEHHDADAELNQLTVLTQLDKIALQAIERQLKHRQIIRTLTADLIHHRYHSGTRPMDELLKVSAEDLLTPVRYDSAQESFLLYQRCCDRFGESVCSSLLICDVFNLLMQNQAVKHGLISIDLQHQETQLMLTASLDSCRLSDLQSRLADVSMDQLVSMYHESADFPLSHALIGEYLRYRRLSSQADQLADLFFDPALMTPSTVNRMLQHVDEIHQSWLTAENHADQLVLSESDFQSVLAGAPEQMETIINEMVLIDMDLAAICWPAESADRTYEQLSDWALTEVQTQLFHRLTVSCRHRFAELMGPHESAHMTWMPTNQLYNPLFNSDATVVYDR